MFRSRLHRHHPHSREPARRLLLWLGPPLVGLLAIVVGLIVA